MGYEDCIFIICYILHLLKKKKRQNRTNYFKECVKSIESPLVAVFWGRDLSEKGVSFPGCLGAIFKTIIFPLFGSIRDQKF